MQKTQDEICIPQQRHPRLIKKINYTASSYPVPITTAQ